MPSSLPGITLSHLLLRVSLIKDYLQITVLLLCRTRCPVHVCVLPPAARPSAHTRVHTRSPSPSAPGHPHLPPAPAGLRETVLLGERVAGAA